MIFIMIIVSCLLLLGSFNDSQRVCIQGLQCSTLLVLSPSARCWRVC
jgi:hypothetical protein